MIATRFAVAAHIMMLLATDDGSGRATSLRIAKSVNTNPVVIRRITGQLARAGLVTVKRGPGGATLRLPADRITLSDVWAAVNPDRERDLLPLHPEPDADCPVGGKVHRVLTPHFKAAEAAMQQALGRVTLDQLTASLEASPVTELRRARVARRAL
jgi:DNA-binding IscR family transcriptional regulator